MFIKKQTHTKTKAQAMVEFALVLMLLLTLIFGILEAGRLLFIYASTVTAARQGVRYGSTTGLNNNNILYYRDCIGIRQAVKQIGFIAPYADSDIHITYDRGLDSNGNPIAIPQFAGKECDTINWSDPNNALRNGDRINVEVSVTWQPIVNFINLGPLTIRSKSARTILSNVSIEVTAAPQGWSGSGNAGLLFTVNPSNTDYSAVGQVITYTYTLRNTGTADLTAPFTVTDNKATVNCGGAPATLPPGQSFVCSGTYIITQADLDAGTLTNSSTASATGAPSSTVSTTILAAQNPSLNLAKSASPNIAATVGANVTYTYTLTNNGNVTLASPYNVSDNKINQISCPSTSNLAPGASTTCTATYSIKNSDINAGVVTNTATATAKFGTQTVTSNQASASVVTAPLKLTITASPATATQANQVITYTYTLQNNSGTTLTSPYTISDDKVTSISCSGAASPLANGASTTCTGTYTITQAMMDSGASITNTATATAKNGTQTVTSQSASATVTISQIKSLGLSVTANPSTATTLNTVVTYTYTLTNTGNVTLSPSYVITDDKASNITCNQPTATLLPAATKTCTGTRTINQTDLNDGSVVSHTTASAVFNSQYVTSSQQTTTVVTYNGPRLTLEIYPNVSAVTTGAGTAVYYTFYLRNTGNVTLASPYSVSVVGNKIPSVDCSIAGSQIAVGGAVSCFGTYTTTQADVNAGSLTIQATATAFNGAQAVTSAQAASTIPVSAPITCYVYHRLATQSPPSISYLSKAFQVTIYNSSSTQATIHIKTIRLFNLNQSTPAGQYIVNLTFNGSNIFTAGASYNYSPVTVNSPFVGDVSLAPGASKTLVVNFNKNYNRTNSEQITVEFEETGCPTLDTNNNSQVKP